MIGLIDLDFQSSTATHLIPPNIEIMKLATYYRTEEKKFCHLIPLNQEEYDGYSKIYLFSEVGTFSDIPKNILKLDNLILGGTALTNQEYVPFENSLIDHTLPLTFIYQDFLRQKYESGTKTLDITHVLDDSYYRITTGTEMLPIPPVRARKRFFIYDRNIFVPGWEKIIDEIGSHSPAAITFIHPQFCRTLDDYFTLRNNNRVSRQNAIILDLDISLDDYNRMLRKYKNLFLADIVKNSTVYISLGGNFSNAFHYYKDFIYKMNLLYLFWANEIYLKLYYVEPKIGFKDPLSHLSQVAATWSYGSGSHKTLLERITIKDKKKINLPMEEKNKLIKFYPSAADLFNQTQTDIMMRRFWKI